MERGKKGGGTGSDIGPSSLGMESVFLFASRRSILSVQPRLNWWAVMMP